jgi:hypothetical protein
LSRLPRTLRIALAALAIGVAAPATPAGASTLGTHLAAIVASSGYTGLGSGYAVYDLTRHTWVYRRNPLRR